MSEIVKMSTYAVASTSLERGLKRPHTPPFTFPKFWAASARGRVKSPGRNLLPQIWHLYFAVENTIPVAEMPIDG